MVTDEAFSNSYSQARERFLSAAKATGADLFQYQHAKYHTEDGTPLSCDVARIGPLQASHKLISISGTHGIEGFAGSAAQIHYLKTLASEWSSTNLAMVFVHAVNPWGFANLSRTTENNVDLNRNFVTHPQPVDSNPLYAELDKILYFDTPCEQSFSDVAANVARITATHGPVAVEDAMVRGQYSHPEGLFYGGNKREWSNRLLEQLVIEHLDNTDYIAVIDWHAGLGDYGKPMYLPFAEAGTTAHKKTLSWWGEGDVQKSLKTYKSGERPHYTGLVFHGVRQYTHDAQVAGGVVEFGTWSTERMLIALILDRWLKLNPDISMQEKSHWQSKMFDEYCPSDPEWRKVVLQIAEDVYRRTMKGLVNWK